LADYSYQSKTLKSQINLVWILSLKNLKLRYKNSVLGFMWSLITPLLYLAIFTFVFSQAFPDIENYPLYALTGLIFWNFYNNASTTTIESVIRSSGVLKSIKVETIALPISEVFTSVINLVLSFIPFGVLMYVFGANISLSTLFIFPLIIIFAIFTLGIGLFLCAFNIYFRDVGFLYTSLASALFYFTPIAYSATLIPAKFLFLVKLNPLYHFMNIFRTVLYHSKNPTFMEWGIVLGITVVFFGIGLFTFKRLERGFISNY